MRRVAWRTQAGSAACRKDPGRKENTARGEPVASSQSARSAAGLRWATTANTGQCSFQVWSPLLKAALSSHTDAAVVHRYSPRVGTASRPHCLSFTQFHLYRLPAFDVKHFTSKINSQSYVGSVGFFAGVLRRLLTKFINLRQILHEQN